MYRLLPPNLIIYIPYIVIGVIFATVVPNYLTGTRILSIVSLIIGQIGMSFVPVIALFPKANLIQSVILAITYFVTTFIICSFSWGLYTLGLVPEYSFIWKDEQFHVNIASLFIANIISFASLLTCFKLVYDEELAKKMHSKGKTTLFKGFRGLGFTTGEMPQMKKSPNFETPKSNNPQQPFNKREGDIFQDDIIKDFGKPFEFHAEKEITKESLPEESSGKLFSSPEQKKSEISDFFSEPEKEKIEPLKSTIIAPPKNIKDELAEIFEQYSSLDAVKKIQDETEVSPKKSKKTEEVLFKLDSEDIEEATFKQIDIPIESKTIPEEALALDIQGDTDVIQKPLQEEAKVEEIKQEEKEVMPKYSQGEIQHLNALLNELKVDDSIVAGIFLAQDGEAITHQIFNDSTFNFNEALTSVFKILNLYINKTNQGNLSNLLLESDNGSVLIALVEGKFLALISNKYGEINTANMLRALSKIEA